MTDKRPNSNPPDESLSASRDETMFSSGASISSSFSEGRFAPGAMLANRYRIVSFLGKGGMGEVFRAEDLSLGQQVALKFLPQDVAADPERIGRLKREVRVGREVAHPNVCRLYDITEIDGHTFVSMEYVDGEDLGTLIRRIGRLPRDKGIDIARQICAGLAAAHAKDVIHRDLKPANVMLDSDGRVRLMDFGLAGSAEDQESGFAGTPVYMAPEQLNGQPASQLTDIYSLGTVLFEVLSGERAFEAKSMADLRKLHSSATHVGTRVGELDIDPETEAVIRRCLEHEPELRPQSAMSVAAALPGADPLAAALAAGETPSPELIAASSDQQGLHPGLGLLGFVAAIALFFAFLIPYEAHSIISYLPLDKNPGYLEQRAREVISSLGFDPDASDYGGGYGIMNSYIRDIIGEQPTPESLEGLRQARPAVGHFWYRQRPTGRFDRGYELIRRDKLDATDPPWSDAGEIYVSLALDGHLRRFFRIPRSTTVRASPDVDQERQEELTAKLFEWANLSREGMEPTAPLWSVVHRYEHRYAMRGPFEGSVATKNVQVEWGFDDNEVAYFVVFYDRVIEQFETAQARQVNPQPAMDADMGDEPTQSGILAWLRQSSPWLVQNLEYGLMVVSLAALLFAGFAVGRGYFGKSRDIVGALRLAYFFGIGILIFNIFGSDHVFPITEDNLVHMLAFSTFIGMGACAGYLGVEPVLRREIPHMLVGWQRLLRGRIFDPAVGRSLLFGVLLGLSVAVIDGLSNIYALEVRNWGVFFFPLAYSCPSHLSVYLFIIDTMMPIFLGLVSLLLYGLARRFFPVPGLPLAVFFVALHLFVRPVDLSFADWSWILDLLGTVIIVAGFRKLGALAGLVSLGVVSCIDTAAWTTALGSWYATTTWLALALVVVLAGIGAFAASKGRASALNPT